jgi:hypothetical protein
MNGVLHPFTKALYEVDTDGNVRVSSDGKWGRFASTGRWLDGELREADPQLCGWVAGPQVVSHRLADAPHG